MVGRCSGKRKEREHVSEAWETQVTQNLNFKFSRYDGGNKAAITGAIRYSIGLTMDSPQVGLGFPLPQRCMAKTNVGLLLQKCAVSLRLYIE